MNSLELSQAHTALVKLRQSLTSKKDEGNVSMEPETFVQTLDETIAQIQSRLHGPQVRELDVCQDHFSYLCRSTILVAQRKKRCRD